MGWPLHTYVFNHWESWSQEGQIFPIILHQVNEIRIFSWMNEKFAHKITIMRYIGFRS